MTRSHMCQVLSLRTKSCMCHQHKHEGCMPGLWNKSRAELRCGSSTFHCHQHCQDCGPQEKVPFQTTLSGTFLTHSLRAPPGGAAVVWQIGPPLLQGEQEPSSSTGTELHPVYVFPVHVSLGPRLISCRPKHIILVWFFLVCGWSMMRSKNADTDVRRDEAFFSLELFGPHQLRRWGCSR